MSFSPEFESKASRLYAHYCDAIERFQNAHLLPGMNPASDLTDSPRHEEFRQKVEACIDMTAYKSSWHWREVFWHWLDKRKRKGKAYDWKQCGELRSGIAKFLGGDPTFELPPLQDQKYRTIDDPWEPS